MFQRKQNNQFTQGQTGHLKLNSVWKLIWDQKPTYQDFYQEWVGIFHCALLCTSYLLMVSFRHRKVSTCRSVCICIEEPFLFKAKFLKIGRGEQLPGPLLFSPLLMLLNLCYYSLWSFSILFPLNTSSQHFPLPCISKAKFIVFP